MSDVSAELDAFCDTLRAHALFEAGAALAVSRAPGRLDVMGGIADYSGFAGSSAPHRRSHVRGGAAHRSAGAGDRQPRPAARHDSARRAPPGGVPISYDQARRMFADGAWSGRTPHWVVVRRRRLPGACARARDAADVGRENRRRLDVPEGKGVSSSAAIETASMHAAATAFGIALEPLDLALLCQKSENLVAGAPCGVMDQMTCVFGERDASAGAALSARRAPGVRPRPGRRRVLGARFRRASRRGRIRLRRRTGGRVHGPANCRRTRRCVGRLSGQHRASGFRAGARSRSSRGDLGR